MSKFASKVASGFLTATTVISLSGFGSFAGVASAQVTDINALMAQIAALQAQIAAMQSAPAAATAACAFTRDLSVGAKGADVTCLQNVLISKGYLAAGLNTGFFGGMTKAATMKWQAAAGVSNTGYFGPKSRAAFAAAMASMPTTPTSPTTPAGPVNTTGSLWVATGAGAPTGSAIAGAGQINVGRFSFTAPQTTGVTVTGMTFNKVGVVSDQTINNLYLADVSTGAIVAQFQSLSASVATFAGLSLNVAAGQTMWLELRGDISTSAAAGNTLAFDLASVTTWNNVPVGGLPVKGNVLTVTTVSNPSIATVTLTETTNGGSANSTIDAGTNGALISQWTANVTNSAVELRSLQFSFVGSANPADVRNLRLLVNGVEAATLPTASTETIFSLAANPIKLATGNSTIQIFGDVAGSPNRVFRLSLLQPYRVNARDVQYGAGITASITSNTYSISINTGSIVVAVASNSPTAAVPAGAGSVTVGKFTIYAAGEPVKIQFIDGALTVDDTDWATIGNVTDDVENVRLVTDNGDQIGNTITTLTSGTTTGTCTLATSSATCHFGTSASPINYIIPANTTRVISVVADIKSGANIGTLQASLPAMSSNLQGQVSFQSASSGAATGASRNVNTSPLVASLNTALTFPTYIAGVSNAKIASFVLTASSAQAANVSSLTFDRDANSGLTLQSMVVKVGSTQFGTTRSTIAATETSLVFSASTPIVVPAGGSVTVDVYSDVVSSSTAGPYGSVYDLTGWSAIGATSGSSITMSPSAVTGQNIELSSGPTLTISVESNLTSPAKQVVMGSFVNSLATIKFLNNNVDDVRITDLTLSDTMTSGSSTASFSNLTLWEGNNADVQVNSSNGVGVSVTDVSAASGTITFSFPGDGVIIKKNASKLLTLKGDVPTFTSGGAISGSAHVFKVNANANVTAKAVGSPSATVTVTGAPASGNSITVYRTKLTLSGAQVLNPAASRTRDANDDLAQFTINNTGTDDQLTVNTLSIKFQGIAVSGVTFNVHLLKTDNTALGSASNPQSCVTVGSSCTVSFNPATPITAGSNQKVNVRVDSTGFFNSTTAGTEGLSVFVGATSGVAWTDGTSTGIGLEASVVPFRIATVEYN